MSCSSTTQPLAQSRLVYTLLIVVTCVGVLQAQRPSTWHHQFSRPSLLTDGEPPPNFGTLLVPCTRYVIFLVLSILIAVQQYGR